MVRELAGWALVLPVMVAAGELGEPALPCLGHGALRRRRPGTATLGMIAGGSAAAVASARDLDADGRQVAFMQYLRLGVVGGTPLLLNLLFSARPASRTASRPTACCARCCSP
ncbi:AbrB family transcriptional regulator [Herbidospora cretacea]|uniref:AbrB family transcriptional regulator n=1 Tax=Herbidospora cretacea TaxID=28444 RepID=UPI0004C2EEC9|nr:AbrB family transcriptional regulator [Herbidospora cretacea]